MDGEELLTYDRSQSLPLQQKDYLDNMDKKLSRGFVLVDQAIEQPDFQQKTQFVALNCVNALLKGDDKVAIIMFTYLVDRMPDLKQVNSRTKDKNYNEENNFNAVGVQTIGVEFIFDEVKPQGQEIHFQNNAKTH